MSFLKGNLITMADGSKKPIEDLQVGDIVLDGYGMKVFVRGLSNLKNRPPYFVNYDYPGQVPIRINNEIVCLKDQYFMGADGYYYLYDGLQNDLVYNKSNMYYFSSYNNLVLAYENFDLRPKTKKLEIGSVLMKDTGPVEVNSIEFLEPLIVSKSPNDIIDMYNNKNKLIVNYKINNFQTIGEDIIKHAVDGRGTYIVNGYICLATQNYNWNYDKNKMEYYYAIVSGDDGILQKIESDENGNFILPGTEEILDNAPPTVENANTSNP